MPSSPLPRLHSAVEVALFEDEAVVFDPRNDVVHHVQGLAAVVLEACQSPTEADLVDEVAEAFGMSVPEAAALIGSAVTELSGAGLLEGGDIPAPPCLGCGGSSTIPSRRRHGFTRRRRR